MTHNRLPVLMYHAVGPYSGSRHRELHVSPSRFEQQIAWLAAHGFTGIAPVQCAAWLLRGEALPERAVLLTFDDAYLDLTTHAFPVLARHGFSAGVFVVTRLLGKRAPWDDQPLMTAGDVLAWSREGIEFGAHSRTHPRLTTLSGERLLDETVASVRDLAALLGRAPSCYAYPYGDHDEHVVRALEAANVIGFTVREGLATRATDPLRIPRTMVQPDDGAVDMWLRMRMGRNPVFAVRGRAKRLWRMMAS